MANHGFVTTKKKLTHARLIAIVNEINAELLGGSLKVTPYGGKEPGVSVVMDLPHNGLPIWLASSRKIEIRHQARGDVGRWIDAMLANELALRLDGTISDEGVSDKWKGEHGKYRTLRDYCESMAFRKDELTPYLVYGSLLFARKDLDRENPALTPFIGIGDPPPKWEEYLRDRARAIKDLEAIYGPQPSPSVK